MSIFSSLFGNSKKQTAEDESTPQSSDESSVTYQFEQPKNTACFTCRHVIDEGADILYVTHDVDDGAWQFLCDGDHEESDAKIIGMYEVVKIDPSINGIYKMQAGVGATRDTRDAEWKPFKQ